MNIDPTVLAQLAAYEAMDVPALAAEYERLFNEKPRCRHKVWLRRNCAWRLQELAYGGLSATARTRLEELMYQITIPGVDGATAPPARPRDPSEPPVGTTLVRDWRGRQIRVTARADGYEFDGRMYRSLSAVATHVTGTKWNGRLWFGLAPTRTRR
jgi:hypothetical protein